MHLTGTELLDWIALRRVSEGGVALHGPEHLDHGRKMPGYLPDAFSRLATAELIEARDPDFPGGPCRLVLTLSGRERYQELKTKRDLIGPEQPSGGCSVPPDRPPSPLRPVRGSQEGTVRWAQRSALRHVRLW
ncbi:MAG: hypothetical protein ACRDTG_00620 [Pseudonocardiaceae bacterium]